MSEEDPTPAEREKILKEVFGSRARLSRPGDPELSSVAISFYPQSEPSKKNTPPKKVRRKVRITEKTKAG
ncbi:MAG: hypothetical protein ACOYOS_15095 [Syntrophales bacterium]